MDAATVNKSLCKRVLNQIERTKNLNELSEIYSNLTCSSASRFDESKYPPIQYSISSLEIKKMESQGILIDDLLNSENFTNKKRTPLERLLYSIIWKQGDLKKIHHIINGIRSNASEYSDCQGIVFQQFGSHLSNSQEEPIIDQHVIRAFGVAHVDLDEIQGLLKMSTFRKKDLPLIHQYSNWLRNLNVYIKESNKQSVIRWIDKILFSLGKDIKVS